MQCPRCSSTHIRKNGTRRGKQNYICVACRRQFIEAHDPKGYSDAIKQECLKMYINGMGFRAIERVKGVHHTTIIHWVKQRSQQLPDVPVTEEIPEVTELDELETFIGSKKQNLDLEHRKPLSTRNFIFLDIRSECSEPDLCCCASGKQQLLFLQDGVLSAPLLPVVSGF